MVDVLASEYSWSHNFIWDDLPFIEIVLYLKAIAIRKLCENGQEEDIPLDASIIDVMTIINKVKAEKRKVVKMDITDKEHIINE